MSKITYRSTKVRTLVAVGVFSALAYVCCVLFHFKAGFLSFDLKDAVMTVAAMLFGPMYGFAMSLMVSAIESLTIGTTELYGFVMDVLSSVSFICVGSFIYSRMRNMVGAVLGMVSSVIVMTAVMMGANMIITPLYMKTTAAEVAAMIPTVLLPFNLTKAVFNASLVFLLYKPFSKALRYSGFTSSVNGNAAGSSIPDITGSSKNSALASVIITVVSIAIGVLALAYFFTVLKGSFTII